MVFRRWCLFIFITSLSLVGGLVLLKSMHTLCGHEFMAIGICKYIPGVSYFEKGYSPLHMSWLTPLAWEHSSL